MKARLETIQDFLQINRVVQGNNATQMLNHITTWLQFCRTGLERLSSSARGGKQAAMGSRRAQPGADPSIALGKWGVKTRSGRQLDLQSQAMTANSTTVPCSAEQLYLLDAGFLVPADCRAERAWWMRCRCWGSPG